MGKKFTVLRVLSWVFRVLGVIVLVVALIAAIASVVAGFGRGFGMMGHYGVGRMMGYWGGFGMFASGLFGGVVLYAAGELVELLLAIEENTRTLRSTPDSKSQPVDSTPPSIES